MTPDPEGYLAERVETLIPEARAAIPYPIRCSWDLTALHEAEDVLQGRPALCGYPTRKEALESVLTGLLGVLAPIILDRVWENLKNAVENGYYEDIDSLSADEIAIELTAFASDLGMFEPGDLKPVVAEWVFERKKGNAA